MTGECQRTAILAAADHLEGWAEELPRWQDDGRETWHAYLDRRYLAEVALMERLRRAPNCRIWTCSMRVSVKLALGGLVVSTDQGLEAALRDWARQAREHPSAG